MRQKVVFSFIMFFAAACGVVAGEQAPTHAPDVAAAEAALSAGPPRVIVSGAPGVDLPAAVAAAGGRVDHAYGIIHAVAVTMPDQAATARLARHPGVTVEADALAYASKPPGGCVPWPECKDDGGGDEPPPEEASQVVSWGINAIGAIGSGYTGAGVKVAVLDTGIDTNHEDLTVAGGINYTSAKGGRPDAYDDDHGHGTHVSGTIAALDNTVGVVGAAPDASLYAVKVLDRRGSGYYSDIIAGIDWSVANGMHVINMSLGGSSHVQALEDAVNAADAAGLMVFAAAGNSGDGDPATDNVGYPAAYDSAIAIAAVNDANTVAWFSSDGPQAELSAPGVNVLSTTNDGSYGDGWNGTSMASPHAAGAAALLLEAYPLHGNSCLRSHMTASAVDLGDPGRDVFYGYGLVDVPAALSSAFAGCP